MAIKAPRLLPFNPATEYFFDEGCFIIEMLNTDDDPHVSVARARVTPGACTKWHRLQGITERYVILEGTGRVEVGGMLSKDVSPGDVVVIPARQKQRITNTADVDLIFLAICSPRFEVSAYQSLE